MFLSTSDFETLINQADLNVIIDNRNKLLSDIEKVGIEEINSYIRQRYDESKVFLPAQTFDLNSNYNAGDRIIWSQTSYNSGSTYNINDYVSYSSATDYDYIYLSLLTGNTNNPLVSSGWTQIALNDDYYVCIAYTTGGTYPNGSLFTQTTTGNTEIPILEYDKVYGWNRTDELYFVTDNYQRTYIYNNINDINTGTNYIGWFPFLNTDRVSAQRTTVQTASYQNLPIETEPRPILVGYEFPILQPIYPGNNVQNFLTGFIKINNYISPNIQWTITPTNVFIQKDTRNPLIKNLLIDIMLYHLHSRINPRNIPELRVIRYQSAIDTLKSIAKGLISIDLPTHLDKRRGANVVFGSQARMINYY